MSMKFQGPMQGGNSVLRWIGNFSLVNRASGLGIIVASENGITFGSTDNKPVTFSGTGAVTINGPTTANAGLNVRGSGEALTVQGAAVGGTNLAYIGFRDSTGARTGFVGDGNSNDGTIYLGADSGPIAIAPAGASAALLVSASAYSFGDNTNNPTYTFNGSGVGFVGGQWTFNAPGNNYAIVANSGVSQYGLRVNGANAGSASFGVLILAGTSAGDNALVVNNQPNSLSFFQIAGNGAISMGNGNYPSLVINNNVVVTGNVVNPLQMGAAGSGASYFQINRGGVGRHYFGDGSLLTTAGAGTPAPAVDDACIRAFGSLFIAPNSGTASAVFSSNGTTTFGYQVTINTRPNTHGLIISSGTTANQSFGLFVIAGTSQNDTAIRCNNGANSANLFAVFGDGSTVCGSATGGPQGPGSLNTQSLFINGVAVTTGTSNSFTGTFTGVSGSPTATIQYSKSGNSVVLTIPAINMTANASTFTLTGLPAAIQPATVTQTVECPLVLAQGSSPTASQNWAAIINAGSGTVTFTAFSSTAYSTTAFGSINARNINATFSISYLTN